MIRIGKILYLPWMIWMIWIPNRKPSFRQNTNLRSYVRPFVKIEHKRHVQSFSLIQRWVKGWEVQKVGIEMVTNVWWQVWQGDENIMLFFPSWFKKWRTCANVHSNNWRCVPCKMDLIMKWNISKCPVFTSRKIHQQILVSFPRQVVNTIFIHGVTTFDKGTLGLRLCWREKMCFKSGLKAESGKLISFWVEMVAIFWIPNRS